MDKSRLAQKMAVLDKEYSSQLRNRVDDLARLWNTIKADKAASSSTITAIKDLAHNLYGSGGFFGYPEVSELAREIEEAIDHWRLGTKAVPITEYQSIESAILKLDHIASTDEPPNEILSLDDDRQALLALQSLTWPGSVSKQILVIDDAPAMLNKLRVAFEECGFQVLEAKSGSEGLSLAARAKPDLIILDLRMPEMDGFEVQRRIRSNHNLNHIPIIFLTAIRSVTLGKIKQAVEYGISDYVVKPFKLSNLIHKVRDVLEA